MKMPGLWSFECLLRVFTGEIIFHFSYISAVVVLWWVGVETEGLLLIFPCWFQMIITHVFLSISKLFWGLNRLSYLIDYSVISTVFYCTFLNQNEGLYLVEIVERRVSDTIWFCFEMLICISLLWFGWTMPLWYCGKDTMPCQSVPPAKPFIYSRHTRVVSVKL